MAIYSNLRFVLFLPSKHSSGKAAIFSMGSCAYNLHGRKRHKDKEEVTKKHENN